MPSRSMTKPGRVATGSNPRLSKTRVAAAWSGGHAGGEPFEAEDFGEDEDLFGEVAAEALAAPVGADDDLDVADVAGPVGFAVGDGSGADDASVAGGDDGDGAAEFDAFEPAVDDGGGR